ncbi:hypothetical protein M9458_033523, partial [Cirrhinus mrigala]
METAARFAALARKNLPLSGDPPAHPEPSQPTPRLAEPEPEPTADREPEPRVTEASPMGVTAREISTEPEPIDSDQVQEPATMPATVDVPVGREGAEDSTAHCTAEGERRLDLGHLNDIYVELPAYPEQSVCLELSACLDFPPTLPSVRWALCGSTRSLVSWTPPQPFDPAAPPRLSAPSSPLSPVGPPFPPGSIVPPAPPWSVVVPPSPQDSTPPAAPHRSVPPAPLGSSLPPGPPQSSVAPGPLRTSGSPPPPRSPEPWAPPWPSGSLASPKIIGSPSPPRVPPPLVGPLESSSTMAPPSVGSAVGYHHGCGLGLAWLLLLRVPVVSSLAPPSVVTTLDFLLSSSR